MITIQYVLVDGIATVIFDEPDSPVNTMCRAWQDDMSSLAEQLPVSYTHLGVYKRPMASRPWTRWGAWW